ncbi:SDR family NAD(P)-dependent oxidoreductase [Tsukamurella soli]|uniref:SDR family oxidoreductase n=1 Tax=Tsukamurella soli TaxID=644556 RepID=A0ABP8JL19_9ACTN
MQEIDYTNLGPVRGARIAVIGSHGGIGAALTEGAQRAGADVIAFDTAQAIAERGEMDDIVTREIDVLDAASITAAAAFARDRWGEVDAVVYVSGIGDRDTPTLEYTVERWDRVHAVNLRGAFLAAQAFVPLIAKGSGTLVFIGSGVGNQPPPRLAAYSASKAGLVAMAKSLAKELAPDIRVNVIAPGIVETAFMAGGTGQGNDVRSISGESWFGGAEAYRKRMAMIPQGRFGNPDDVAAPTLFLLGPGARFITGQTIHVNGGIYLP